MEKATGVGVENSSDWVVPYHKVWYVYGVSESKRKSRRDWLEAAIRVFATEGSRGLRIENLQRVLGVTKGSFYHHFGSAAEFRSAFLKFYEEEGTFAVIEMAEKGKNAPEKLRRLLSFVVEFSREDHPNPEVNLRAWALTDPAVGEVIERVDGRRRSYLRAICREIVNGESQADLAADLIYTVLVGCEQVKPPLAPDRLQELFGSILHHQIKIQWDRSREKS